MRMMLKSMPLESEAQVHHHPHHNSSTKEFFFREFGMQPHLAEPGELASSPPSIVRKGTNLFTTKFYHLCSQQEIEECNP